MGSQYNFYDNRETYDVILNAEFNITRMLGGYPFPYDFDYSQTYEEEFFIPDPNGLRFIELPKPKEVFLLDMPPLLYYFILFIVNVNN